MPDADTIRTVTHTASGASIQVHPYGGTVLSYKSSAGRDHLFVSETAILDGSKPVRGGIPLVFPIFGPPGSATSTMPQHGFARRSTWVVGREYDTAESAGIIFGLNLKDVEQGRGEQNIWEKEKTAGPYDCSLELTVDFSATTMTTTMTVKNTGVAAFPFQALLHTYYKVNGNAALNKDQCFVKGLEGYTVTDKVIEGAPYAADSEPIGISSETDRVYAPPAGKDVVAVTIGVGDNETVSMTASAGANDGAAVPVSCVVWNPYKIKAAGMADFGTEQYHDMICVEPGILGDDTVLEPGKEAFLKQVMSV